MIKYNLTVLSPAYLDMVAAIRVFSEYAEEAAIRFVDELEERFSLIEQWPEMYPEYEDFPIYRKTTVMDYLIFYTIDKRAATVEVHRIIYGKRDIKRIIDKEIADEQ